MPSPPESAIRWIEGDATYLPTLGADLAVMTGNVAQVFTTDESWQVTLTAIRGALRTGGHLVFEARRPSAQGWKDWEDPEGTEHSLHVPGTGEVHVRQTRLDVDLPLVTFAHEYRFPDGTMLDSSSTLRFREESELRLAALLAGFEVVEVREAPDRPGREHVVIARAV